MISFSPPMPTSALSFSAPQASADHCPYNALLEASPMIFFHYDQFTDVLTLSMPSKARQRIMQTQQDFCLTLPANPYIPFKLRQSMQEMLEHYCSAPCTGHSSFCLDIYGDGAFRWYVSFMLSQAEADGKVRYVTGYLRDIEAEKINELHLENLSIYRKAVDFASLFVYEFDLPAYHPQDAGQHQNIDYYPLQSYLTNPSQALIHPDDLSIFNTLTQAESLLTTYRAQQYELRAALRLKDKQDNWNWVQFTIHLSHGSDNREAHGIGYIQLIQSQKQLEERATLDAVTGLLNRATIEERIRATLRDTNQPCYFFIFDIDNFKAVNDSSGHFEGDNALKIIADIMRSQTRKTDLLGRLGGDEFVVLLSGMPSIDSARSRAEQILSAVRQFKCPASWQGIKGLSLSAGMAVSIPDKSDYEDLYRAADQALYRAKGEGKNCCCVAES